MDRGIMQDINEKPENDAGASESPDQPVITGASLTPMVRQYQEIKARHRDKILFFRVGDFYEMFFEDAVRRRKF